MKNFFAALCLAVSVIGCGQSVDALSSSDQEISDGQSKMGCPSTWAQARQYCRTSGIGVAMYCSYPGAGDCFGEGQCATAVLSCGSGDGGISCVCGQ